MTDNKPSISALYQAFALPLLLSSLSLLLQIAAPTSNHWLRFERMAIIDGEWWRILTGNLVHLGWQHLWMNLAGLILIWLLFGRLLSNRQWLIVITISALGVSLGLLVLNPRLEWYVGLSGLLHGVFIVGLLTAIQRGLRIEILLLLFFVGKLAWEQYQGAMPGSAEFAGGTVIVDSHLYGTISGLLVWIYWWVMRLVKR